MPYIENFWPILIAILFSSAASIITCIILFFYRLGAVRKIISIALYNFNINYGNKLKNISANVKSPKSRIFQMIQFTIVYASIVALLYKSNQVISILLFFIASIFTVFIFSIAISSQKLEHVDSSGYVKKIAARNDLLLYSIFWCYLLIALTATSLEKSSGSFEGQTFLPVSNAIAFSIDQLLKALPLFDWSDSFDISSVFNVTPGTDIAKFFTFCVRVLLDLIIVSALLHAIQTIISTSKFQTLDVIQQKLNTNNEKQIFEAIKELGLVLQQKSLAVNILASSHKTEMNILKSAAFELNQIANSRRADGRLTEIDYRLAAANEILSASLSRRNPKIYLFPLNMGVIDLREILYGTNNYLDTVALFAASLYLNRFKKSPSELLAMLDEIDECIEELIKHRAIKNYYFASYDLPQLRIHCELRYYLESKNVSEVEKIIKNNQQLLASNEPLLVRFLAKNFLYIEDKDTIVNFLTIAAGYPSIDSLVDIHSIYPSKELASLLERLISSIKGVYPEYFVIYIYVYALSKDPLVLEAALDFTSKYRNYFCDKSIYSKISNFSYDFFRKQNGLEDRDYIGRLQELERFYNSYKIADLSKYIFLVRTKLLERLDG